MKTILPLLLLLAVTSCARRPPTYSTPREDATPPPPPRPTPAAAETPRPFTPAAVPTPAPAAMTNVIVTPPATNAPLNPAVAAALIPAPLSAAAAAFAPPPGADQILPAGMIDFRNMPLDQVLDVYAELVGRTLLRPTALPAQQITLKTQTQLTKAEAIQALDSVLALNGITMVYFSDKFVKVVAEAQVYQQGAPFDERSSTNLPTLGQFVTHIVQMKYAKPSETVQVLMPFAKIPNSILPIDSSGILVLRDYTENVKRMLEMIERIDIAMPAEFISEVIPIKYAKASEIADALNSLSGGGGGSTSINRSGAPAARSAVPGASRPGLPGGGGSSPFGSAQPYGSSTPYGGGGAGGIGGGGGGAPGAGSSMTDRIQRIIQRASTSGDLQILGQTKMIADERSNSLLIFATRQDMDMIKTIVSKLDVVLSQVLIETIILDVSLSNQKALGFSAVQTPKSFDERNPDGTLKTGGAGGMNAATFFDFAGQANNTNVFSELLGTGLRYFAKVDNNYLLQVQAAASQGRVNVIQKPRILTSHATPGSIFVGSTVPYVTSTYYGGGYGGPSSSYQQLQVGIGLTVTPYINPDGLVVMQIDETIDELAGSTEITGVGAVPNTTSRKLSAEIAVRDGDSIILGGFIRNATTKNSAGVPLLKDLPLLGALFSSRSSSKDRTELLVLMRPTVLKTPEIAAMATGEEKSRMPGVIAAEAEVIEEERKELEQSRKDAEKRKINPNR
jgi:general secretion pathway protein D